MNYNDIKSRIDRTFVAINAKIDNDIEKHTHYHFYEKNGEQRVTVTYGTEVEKELILPIMSIIHLLATLKDHIKNSLKEKGHDPLLVERTIDESIHLQILIDIDNQDKHGTNLRRSRSNKSPVITDVHQGFYMGSKVYDIEGNIINENGLPTIAIKALIKDGDGSILFYLDEMIEICYSKWIEIIKKYQLATI